MSQSSALMLIVYGMEDLCASICTIQIKIIESKRVERDIAIIFVPLSRCETKNFENKDVFFSNPNGGSFQCDDAVFHIFVFGSSS